MIGPKAQVAYDRAKGPLSTDLTAIFDLIMWRPHGSRL